MAGTRNQVEGLPWYRAARATGVGVDADAMNQIDTSSLVDRARCWVTATGRVYYYDQDSVAVADGVNVVAPTSNVGRWLILFESAAPGVLGSAYQELRVNAGATALEYTDVPVVFAPVMSWAAFIALVNVQAAFGRAVQMGPGTWTADVPGLLSSYAVIYGGPKVIIDATIGIGGGSTDAVFLAQGVTSAGNTTLSAASAAGATTISVASLTPAGGTIAAGSVILIQGVTNVWQMSCYVVQGAPTGVGPYVVTLDRPLFRGFASGDKVFVVTSRPENIHIDGRGMLMTGATNRYVELAMAFNCTVENITVDGSGGTSEPNDYMAAFDAGGVGNTFRNLIVDGTAINSGACLALESNERSVIERCAVSNNLSTGYLLLDDWNCKVLDSQAYNCKIAGFRVSGETVGGSYSTTIRGCAAERCAVSGGTPQGGILTELDSADTIVDDCTILACGDVVGLSGGICLLGTTTRTRISKTRLLNCAAFAGINIAESTVTDTIARDMTFDGCLIGFVSYGGDYLLDGFRIINTSATGATTGSVGVSNSAVCTKSAVRNGYISVPIGNGTYGIAWTGDDATARMLLDNVHVSLTGAGVRVAIYHKTGVLKASNVLVDGAGAAANFGLYANGGIIRLGDGIDVGACGTPTTGITSVGQVVSGGTGAAEPIVAWTDLKLTDHITWTRLVNGGAPGIMPLCTKTPGTGFTPTFAAGDTSTYEYRVE